jgi:GH24 family phage-related lysozyme (muramidase)
MTNTAPITLEQLFRFKRPWGELPHQDAAISELEADIRTSGYAVAMRRDRPWFRAWSQDGKQADPVALALPLIRSFEDCKMEAYPDPGTGGEPITIGWGSTTYANGNRVRPGDTITQQKADELLDIRVRNDLLFLQKVIPSWGSLTAHQQAALLSFSYNVGRNWYGGEGFDTITARVRDGDHAGVPKALELYVNPGTNVEEGLRRRREAEGRLWQGPDRPSQATPKAKPPPHLTLHRTKRPDSRGLELLSLKMIVDSVPMAELLVVSGAAGAQAFRIGARSRAKSLEPLPEGRYSLGPVEWAGQAGDYAASWGPGLGAVWVSLNYAAPGHTSRSALGCHLDENAKTAPGSAGCVVFRSTADLRTFVGWMSQHRPRELYVNWGLGTCPAVKAR